MINRKYLEDAKMRVLASLGSMTPEQPQQQPQQQSTGFPMQTAQSDAMSQMDRNAYFQATGERISGDGQNVQQQPQRQLSKQLQPSMESQGKIIDYDQQQSITKMRNDQLEKERLAIEEFKKEQAAKSKTKNYYGYKSPADL